MPTLIALCRTFRDDTRGVTSIEYALLASLIAMVILGAVSALGKNVLALYELVATSMP